MSPLRQRIAGNEAGQDRPPVHPTGCARPDPRAGELLRAVPVLVLFLIIGAVWLKFGTSIMHQQ